MAEHNLFNCYNNIIPGCLYFLDGAKEGYVWTSDDVGKGSWQPLPDKIFDQDDLVVQDCLILEQGAMDGYIWTSDDVGKGCWKKPSQSIGKKYPIDENNISLGDFIVIDKENGNVSKIKCEEWDWLASYTNDQDISINKRTMVKSHNGCIYVCGVSTMKPYFYDANTLNELEGNTHLNNQIFIAKIDECGNFMWQASIISDTSGVIDPSIAIDDCDNIYIVGKVEEDMAIPYFFNYDTPSLDTSNAAKNGIGLLNQTFVAKMSGDGEFEWVAGIENGENACVAVGKNGYIYIGGQSEQPIFYNTGSNTPTITGKSGLNGDLVFICSINEKGYFAWSVYIDSENFDDMIMDLTVDKEENIYVLTQVSQGGAPNMYDKDGMLVLSGRLAQNGVQTNVSKVDVNGVWLFQTSIDPCDDSARLDIDCYNNVYVTGIKSFSGMQHYFNADQIESDILMGRNTASHIYISRLDETGCWVWEANVDIIQPTLPSIHFNGRGSLFIAFGALNENIPYFYNANNNSLDANIVGRQPVIDQLVVAKLRNDGVWFFQQSIESSIIQQQTKAYDIVVDDCGNVYVSGQVDMPIFFNPNNVEVCEKMMGLNANSVIAKISNEARSSTIIGIIQSIEGNMATILFKDEVKLDNLVIGKSYYLSTTYMGDNKVVTFENNPCEYSNRHIGVACSTDTLIMKVNKPIKKVLYK